MKHIINRFAVMFMLFFTVQVSAQQKGEWLEQFDIAQYKNKVVYLDFWASWCAPCRKTFPWLNEMQAKYQDKGLVIIAINLDRKIEGAYRFVNATPADFPLYWDAKSELAKKYKITGLPSSLLFSGDGELKDHHTGFKKSEQQSYEANIVKLLEQLPCNRESEDKQMKAEKE